MIQSIHFLEGGCTTKQKHIQITLAVSLFLIALGITLYPLISTAYNSCHQSLIHTQYNQELANTDAQFLQQNRELAVQYNTALVPGAQQVDAFSSAAVELASVDYANLLNIAGNGCPFTTAHPTPH